MNIYTNTNSAFPSQVVPDSVKASEEYGLQVSRAIEQEWFEQGRTTGNRYLTNWNNFHQLRLYARGEQSVQKYKDELSINGDLSYLNLDWTPVPILSKFVDIGSTPTVRITPSKDGSSTAIIAPSIPAVILANASSSIEPSL